MNKLLKIGLPGLLFGAIPLVAVETSRYLERTTFNIVNPNTLKTENYRLADGLEGREMFKSGAWASLVDSNKDGVLDYSLVIMPTKYGAWRRTGTPTETDQQIYSLVLKEQEKRPSKN